MTLWEQFNPGKSLAAAIRESEGIDLAEADEKALYETLKRHLTRRELKCFVMRHGGKTTAAIAEAVRSDAQSVEQMQNGIRTKFRRPKLQEDLLRCLSETNRPAKP